MRRTHNEPTDVLRRSTRGKKIGNSRKEQSATGLSDARRGDGNSSQGSKEKRGSYRTYSLSQKIKIVQHARKHSEYAASLRYKVARSTIYEWKDVDKSPAAVAKAKKKFPSARKGKHLKKDAGRPITYCKEIDDNLIAWVLKTKRLALVSWEIRIEAQSKSFNLSNLAKF